ncbi:parallel beta-helix domain-containing protein [Microbulbifer sp. SSSA002]|uniref:parallel beta-helix domain-containing protein n=1 Tax=unclassified Microbulbifer TaxID=2619833 RepID=UPI00403A3407
MKVLAYIGVFLFVGVFLGCAERSESGVENGLSGVDFQKQLLKKMISAQAGDVIDIPAGKFPINRSLSLNVDGVTLRGAGMDKTILSFKGQIQGAEGILVNASDFTIENLAIEDTLGDALKVNEGENIVIRDVRVEWTNGPSTRNGAYGIYPVQTKNTLIDGVVAIGASDAGIYVGQSQNVIVRNSRAEFNVAGIEVENTIAADVYNNVAVNNTGGILVFNMPNLPQPGHSTRIYHNTIKNNNTANFAHKGTAVAAVPAGSGVVVNSNDRVEIFKNNIADNNTANILISSYFTAGYYSDKSTQVDFDPYPEGIYIYANNFSGGGTAPDHFQLKTLKLARFGVSGALPDILWDGAVDPEKLLDGHLADELKLCIDNGSAGILNVDALNNYKNISTDIAPHRCHLSKLAKVVLEFDTERASDTHLAVLEAANEE